MRILNACNIAIIALAANFYLIIVLSPGLFSQSIFFDDGAMSIVNMVLISAVWAICLVKFVASPGARISWFCWLYVVEIYLLREADFHQAFTEIHVTRGSFYTAEVIPFGQKLIVGAITLAFLICLLTLLVKHTRTYLTALKQRAPWAVSLCLWFVCLAASQLLDKSALNESPYWEVRSIEEMLEITAAVYALAAITFFLFQTRRGVADSTRPG